MVILLVVSASGAALGALSSFSFVSCAQLVIRASDRIERMARRAIEPADPVGSPGARRPLLPVVGAWVSNFDKVGVGGRAFSEARLSVRGSSRTGLDNRHPESKELKRARVSIGFKRSGAA